MEIIGLRIDMQDTFCLTLLIHACDKGHGWLFGGNGNVCEGGQKSTACHFDCLKEEVVGHRNTEWPKNASKSKPPWPRSLI